MFATLLLSFIPQETPQPRARPLPAVAKVAISDRFISLPPIPESAAKAHSDFGPLRKGMTEGLKDLERTLKRLYASPEAALPLPPSFKVPRGKGEDLRFLVSVVSEERYRELETPFIQAWNEWQTVLVQNGLAEPVQMAVAGEEVAPASSQENKDVQRRLQGMAKSESALREEQRILVEIFTLGGRGTNLESVKTMQQAHAEADGRLITTRTLAKVADRHAPALSKTWLPLAERLNADAIHLADLEAAKQDTADAGMMALRVQARIHFLERFRTALWISNLVWARMTSTAVPPPLEDLAPPASNPGS